MGGRLYGTQLCQASKTDRKWVTSEVQIIQKSLIQRYELKVSSNDDKV